MMRILGAVLAGGRSSRFGSDKAMALLQGKPLIDWTFETLTRWTDHVVICGREGGLADRPGPDLGPLGGLNAALHHARAGGFDAVLSAPCDAPLLPDEAFRRLREAALPAYLASLPVVGLWPVALADALDRHLTGSDRSVRRWAMLHDATPVELDLPIPNVNTPDDLLSLGRGSTT